MEYNQAERRRAMILKIYRKDADDDNGSGDGKGRWVTTEGGHHIHINENGEPDKGNPHAIKQMKKAGGFGKVERAKVLKAEAKARRPIEARSKLSYRDKQLVTNKIKSKMEWVKKNMSNTYSPFEKEESPDMGKIMKRGGVDETVAKDSLAAANKVYDAAAAKEPKITKDMVSVAKDAGGTMFGLPSRLKQPTSMAGKIAFDVAKLGKTPEEAANDVKDAVRYTAIFPEDNFTEGYYKVKDTLEKKGYKEVRCKNFYQMYDNPDPDKRADQRAVQCVYKDPSGYVFEFQFHTVESAGAKEVNHPLYDEWREGITPPKRKSELSKNMRYIGTHVPVPRGVMDIKSHG